MKIRKAEFSDIVSLVDNRLEFICSIRSIDNVDEFKKQTRIYLEKHIDDGTVVSYVATDKNKIVASCILCIYETLPTPCCLCGKNGLLLNVYTLKEYRKQGLAFNILTALIDEAKQLGIGKILLDYTDDGYALYKKLGFESLDREMALEI